MDTYTDGHYGVYWTVVIADEEDFYDPPTARFGMVPRTTPRD